MSTLSLSVLTHAESGTTLPTRPAKCEMSVSGSTQTKKCELQARKIELKKKIELIREANKKARTEAKDTLKEFKKTESGAILEMKNTRTPEDKKLVQDARTATTEARKDLKQAPPEQKKAELQKFEDAKRAEIDARYKNATGAVVEKRMEIYDQNKDRRAEAVDTQVKNQEDRANLTLESVQQIQKYLEERLPKMTADQKAEALKKVIEHISVVESNKKIPETAKAQILEILRGLRAKLQ
jgi:hypothetical protein